MSKKHKILFLIILALGIFVRIYKVYENPSGIHVDEAGMFVDANMLVKYGTDRYGTSFPIYFTNFGGGQSIMYGYIVAALIKIFGCTQLLIRVPSLTFGILLIIIGYLIAREFLNTKESLLVMAIISFCPYFIQASRIGLDCNLFLPMFTLSLYILIKAIKKQKNLLFLISGITYGFCLYTYAVSYLIVPFFLLLCTIYLIINKQINYKNILYLSIPLFLIALPLILFILVNYNILNEFKLIIFDIKKLPHFRTAEIGFKNILDNILMIIYLLGYDFLNYNAIKYFGTIYYCLVPFFIIGLVRSYKNIKKFKLENLILISFFSCYIQLLLVHDININKSNAIFFSIAYITAYGIISSKSKKIFNLSITLLIINFLIFTIYYKKNDTANKLYSDNTIYKIVNEKYDTLKDKKIIIITNTVESKIYERIGRILNNDYDDPTEKKYKKKVYIIRNTIDEINKYKDKKNIIINDYHLIYE